MDKTQYIGEKEIKGIEKNVVTFADDSQEEFTEKQLTYLVTEEVTDPSEQRELVLKNTVPEVFEVLKKHNIRYGDLDAVINSIAWGYKVALYKAIGKKMGTYQEWKHIEYFMEDITMSKIEDAVEGGFNF